MGATPAWPVGVYTISIVRELHRLGFGVGYGGSDCMLINRYQYEEDHKGFHIPPLQKFNYNYVKIKKYLT